MKRFATLALVVFALATVPAAFADDSTPTPSAAAAAAGAPAQSPRQNGGGGDVRMRVELLRLRLEFAKLRFRLHCGPNGKAPADRCHARAEQMIARLQKIDAGVEAKLAVLKACTADSTDPTCRNAERKSFVLTKLDTRLRSNIQKLQDYLDGKTTTPVDPSSDPALAPPSSELAGSNG